MKTMLECLKRSHADEYRVIEKIVESSEAFFIGQKLDMNRAKKVKHTELTVYKDSEDKKYRGSATKEIHTGLSEAEIAKEIEDLLFAASFVQNPMFPLVENNQAKEESKTISLNEQLAELVKAMQSVSESQTEKINSYEIFVSQTHTHIVNSKGVDVSFSSHECHIEVVINAKKDNHEIELIKDLKFANKNADEIKKEIEKMFENGKDRLNARFTANQEHARVLLTGEDVPQFFRYFLMHTNAEYVYMGLAKAKLNEKISGDEADDITIQLVKHLQGSTHNQPYDADGNAIKDLMLYEKGVCKSYWGNQQKAYYIGLENPTSYTNVIVSGGSVSLAELKKEAYLEITDFSSFIMDPIAGYFGGEIRLGYAYDGKNTVSVAGGSLSANFSQVLKHVRFSKETRQMNNWIVPCAIELSDVTIAGE